MPEFALSDVTLHGEIDGVRPQLLMSAGRGSDSASGALIRPDKGADHSRSCVENNPITGAP